MSSNYRDWNKINWMEAQNSLSNLFLESSNRVVNSIQVYSNPKSSIFDLPPRIFEKSGGGGARAGINGQERKKGRKERVFLFRRERYLPVKIIIISRILARARRVHVVSTHVLDSSRVTRPAERLFVG